MTVTNFPPLYGADSKGQVRKWSIEVQSNEEVALIITKHGLLGGKMQIDTRMITEGKNLGRSNATTPAQQAEREAQSAWQSKVDENYVDDLDKLGQPKAALLPMLAHPFAKKGHVFDWSNAYLQPKLDGTRCLATIGKNTVTYTSRNGKPITTVDHLTQDILKLGLPIGTILDGEIYKHGMDFQTLVSAVKKIGPHTPALEYWIYDLADTDSSFKSRSRVLSTRFFVNKFKTGHVQLVETHEVATLAEALESHSVFTGLGYEGSMLRDGNSLYRFDHRSDGLLKLKDFLDSEYVITGSKEGEGREKGLIIFTCQTSTGMSFDVRPEGSHATRAEWWAKRTDFVGKQLTVRYQNLTNDGVPRFPVGVAVRDYE